MLFQSVLQHVKKLGLGENVQDVYWITLLLKNSLSLFPFCFSFLPFMPAYFYSGMVILAIRKLCEALLVEGQLWLFCCVEGLVCSKIASTFIVVDCNPTGNSNNNKTTKKTQPKSQEAANWFIYKVFVFNLHFVCISLILMLPLLFLQFQTASLNSLIKLEKDVQFFFLHTSSKSSNIFSNSLEI